MTISKNPFDSEVALLDNSIVNLFVIYLHYHQPAIQHGGGEVFVLLHS